MTSGQQPSPRPGQVVAWGGLSWVVWRVHEHPLGYVTLEMKPSSSRPGRGCSQTVHNVLVDDTSPLPAGHPDHVPAEWPEGRR